MPDSFQGAIDSNQNTELRIIIQRFEQITQEVKQNRQETRELFATLRGEMREGMARIEKQLEDHESRLRKVESNQTELSARVTMSQILQTTFATIVASIAAVVGAIFK